MFGISRGGGAALVVASCCPGVRAILCDSVFSTRLTLISYMRRWISIFAIIEAIYTRLPYLAFAFLADSALGLKSLREGVRFPRIEDRVKALRHTALFFIHGQRDSYVRSDQIEPVFHNAPGWKEMWSVPKAKHNRAIDARPDEYRRRARDFFIRHVRDADSPAGESPAPRSS